MKKSIFQLALIALVAGLLSIFSQNIKAQTAALPTLRGGAAVKQLKQTGGYNSLLAAVKAARQAGGQADETDAPDAVGQSARLLAAGGAANDVFGISIAISGDTAIVGAVLDDVGANTDQGSAYIFTRSGTTWTQQAQLNASDGAADDQFGISVSISGDTAIVGAYADTVGANPEQGSAYIYTRSGTMWTQQAQLNGTGGAANDNFGISVGISGNTAVVGANFATVGANIEQGSAYVFTRSGTLWTQQAQLNATDGAANDNFGFSIAVSGDTVIVGAVLDDVGANTDQGSAYIFTRSGINWSQQAQLNGTGGAANDNFGYSVAISSNTVIVGAVLDDVGANTDQGSAFIFTRSGTMWTQQAQLTATGGATNDFSGISVGISGDTAIVGGYGDDVGMNADQGSAYIFTRSGTTWTQQVQLNGAGGATGDLFGVSVAVSGDTAVVGAFADNINSNIDQGSAFVFRTLSSNWTQEAKTVAAGGAEEDQLGNSVAISGDTAIVGAPSDNVGGNTDQGSAYIFTRSGTVWTQQAQLFATGGASFDLFGTSVAVSGDTVIVGAVYDDVGANNDQGSAYVFTRTGTVWTQQTQLTATGGAANDSFGNSVGISGDTVIVGAYADTVGANNGQGSAYIFTRSGTAWSQQEQLFAADGASLDMFGNSVAISGDTAVVGAYGDDVGANNEQGSAYIFTRSGTVWTQQSQLLATGGVGSDFFGISVGISGDTAIVGACFDDTGANGDQGSAYIFTRSETSWSQQAQLLAAGGAANDLFGVSVGISGDTVIVGANGDDVGANSDQGSAYIFERSGTTWTQRQQLFDSSGAANDLFGRSVAISGDKVVVGAPSSDVSTPTPFNGDGRLFAPNVSNQGAALFFVNAPLVPTAVNVSISGRVITPQDLGLTNAIVTLTDSRGNSQTIRTGKFGNFIFRDVAAGETYILTVSSKRYTYAPQIVSPTENITGITLTPQ